MDDADARERLTNLLAACHDDPDLFNSSVLCRPPYWRSADSPQPQYPGQREWCDSIVRYHTVAIETGNMLGKDYWIGGIVPWWLWTRRNSLVFVTGPGQTTIGSVTWKEVRRAVEGCPFWPRYLRARISKGIKTSPHVVEVSPGWQALGYSTTNVERASGQHAGQLLVIVEEASGVEDEAWEAINSLGASKIVAIGNPLRADGGFARLCDRADAESRDGTIPDREAARRYNVPSTASPHAQLDSSPVGLAHRTWIQQTLRHYGRDSIYCKAHVFAERPKVSSGPLIEERFLDWAASRPTRVSLPIFHPIHQTRRISCDLAEGVGRDSTAIVVRDDWGILEVVWGSAMGLPEAATKIRELMLKFDVPQERISYDKVGIGRDFGLDLARVGITRAVGYAGDASPRSPDFANLRTEAAWKVRQRLDPEGADDFRSPQRVRPDFSIPAGPYWTRLREELKTLTYELAGQKTKLLSKKDWCAILGHSPDLADALIQSFAF